MTYGAIRVGRSRDARGYRKGETPYSRSTNVSSVTSGGQAKRTGV